MSDNIVRLVAYVHGEVQGVGFRWWTRARALELGLLGHARNLSDGRVEVQAEGPQPNCEQLLAQLQPQAAAAPGVPARPGTVRVVVSQWLAPRGLDPQAGFVER